MSCYMQADGAQLPWRRGGPWDLTTLGLLCYFFFRLGASPGEGYSSSRRCLTIVTCDRRVPIQYILYLSSQCLIAEGCGLQWESYKLDPYVQRLADTVINFQEKVCLSIEIFSALMYFLRCQLTENHMLLILNMFYIIYVIYYILYML